MGRLKPPITKTKHYELRQNKSFVTRVRALNPLEGDFSHARNLKLVGFVYYTENKTRLL